MNNIDKLIELVEIELTHAIRMQSSVDIAFAERELDHLLDLKEQEEKNI